LGDADTTGAICGQIAGAFYGMSAIDTRLIASLRTWDAGEIALRGALLVVLGGSPIVRGWDHWLPAAEGLLTDEQVAADLLKQEGNKHYEARRFEDALDKYACAIDMDPNELTYHFNRWAVWIEMGEQYYDKVIAEGSDLLKRRSEVNRSKPGGASSEKVAKLLNRMASVFSRRRQWKDALDTYMESLTEDNRDETRTAMKKVMAELQKEEAAKTVID